MKKTLTILAALALGVGPGIQVSFAADPAVDALRPAVGGIIRVNEGETKTGSDFAAALAIPQNAGANNFNRTALIKDGQGTLLINQDTAINHSFVVREGTVIIQDAALTNTTTLESPNLTVGGTNAHLVLDAATYTHGVGYVSAVVVGGRDGDGSLTLMNGSFMKSVQGLFAGYPSVDLLTTTADPNQFTDAHVAGTYLSSDENDGLYRDQNPEQKFSSDYTYTGPASADIRMSEATINILSGSRYEVGTALYLENALVNISGEGSLLHVGARATGIDSSIGVSSFSDGGHYQTNVVINVTDGGKLQMDCTTGERNGIPLSQGMAFLGYGSASAQINVSGVGSTIEIHNAVLSSSLQNSGSTVTAQINVTGGAKAVVDKIFAGGATKDTSGLSVIYVDAASSYEGDHADLDYGSKFINEGHTTLKGLTYYSLYYSWNASSGQYDPVYELISSSLKVVNDGIFLNAAGATLEVGEGGSFQLEKGGTLLNYGEITQLNGTSPVCSVDALSLLGNYGTMNVPVKNSGTVLGSGTFLAYMAKDGSVTYVGTPMFEDGVLSSTASQAGVMNAGIFRAEAGTSLVFFVDGDVAATQENDGSGTYSNIVVDNGGLRADAGISAELVLGSGAFKRAMARADKAIPLQLVTEQAAAADAAATDRTLDLNMTYQVSGEHAELFSVDENGILRLVLAPDAVAAATVHGASDLLNTLWTSTGMVQDFARKAVMTQAASRLSSPQTRMPDASEHVTGVDLWGSGLGYFANMGGARGFDFNSGGYAVGCDAELLHDATQSARVGLAFGQSFGTFKSDIGSKVDQEALMFALYGGAERKLSDRTSLYLGAYAAYGRVDNDARTRFMEGSAGYADWDDDVWSFGLQAELNYKVTDRFTVSPFTGIDYVYGSHGSFLEDFGDGLRRSYSSGSMQVWRVPVGVRFSTMMELGGNQVLLPELSVAYVGDISRSNPHATVDVAGAKARVRGSNPGRSALMLQAGATWIMNDRWSTGAAYHLEARSGQTAQGVNAYVRYRF